MRSTDPEHDHVEHAMHMSHEMPPTTAAGHMGHDQHAGHSVAMFRNKFWLTLILTLPVVVWSTEVQHWLGYTAPAFPGSQYIPAFLGTVVFLYGGSVFIRGASGELADRRPGMMTLISLGIVVAFAITLRGIGEMAGDKNASNTNPATSWMDLSPFEVDEFGKRRAFVNLVTTADSLTLWNAMDQAAIQLAQTLAGSAANIEYFYDNAWHAAPPPAGKVRDGLGTTHHEAGTLWMGTAPANSVTDLDGRFHHIQNAYAAGPAVFPALGSANPSLTAFTLARRTANAVVQRSVAVPATGTVSLLNSTLDGWQMAGSGRFNVVGSNTLESEGGIGLLWYTKEEFSDFLLTVQWRSLDPFDNSGVFLRFPNLGNQNPAEDWKLAVDQGYEVQIDDRGFDPNTNTTGSPLHMTGAVYQLAPATALASKPLGEWNTFEIEAAGSDIRVRLNGQLVSHLTNNHGRPLKGHIGLQNHHPGSRVQFRNLLIKRTGAVAAAGRSA